MTLYGVHCHPLPYAYGFAPFLFSSHRFVRNLEGDSLHHQSIVILMSVADLWLPIGHIGWLLRGIESGFGLGVTLVYLPILDANVAHVFCFPLWTWVLLSFARLSFSRLLSFSKLGLSCWFMFRSFSFVLAFFEGPRSDTPAGLEWKLGAKPGVSQGHTWVPLCDGMLSDDDERR
jgi:hypothetical protein